MELRDAVRSRRSIRAFLSKPVPEETVNDLISESLWAPSWGNTQPWGITVAVGDVLDRFRQENTQAFLSGKEPATDIPIPFPDKWPDAMVRRYHEVGGQVLKSLSIPRDDHGSRVAYYARMYALFDAPALVLISVERDVALAYCMLDVGNFLQTFCLLAWDRGLGTCIMGAAIYYADIVRRHFAIAKTRTIAIGAALGWPDNRAPVNRFERKRGLLEEFLKWVR